MTSYPGMRRYVAVLGAAMGSSALALNICLGTGMLAPPALAQEAAVSFDIPAQDLNRAAELCQSRRDAACL